jgi:hypothetical protein
MADKEYIERGALIENLNRFAPECYNTLVNQLIIKQPAADVVEVVRCEGCKFYEKAEYDGGTKDVCRLFKRQMQPCDYCSYGKRKHR